MTQLRIQHKLGTVRHSFGRCPASPITLISGRQGATTEKSKNQVNGILQMLELKNHFWHVGIRPDMGAALLFGEFQDGASTWKIFPDCRKSERDFPDLAEASFNMAPYSNRILDGKFQFNGTSYQLESGAHHAIHGFVRDFPWRVIASSAEKALLQYDHHPNPSRWPWSFACQYEISLDDDKLRQRISIVNTDKFEFPAGLGLHPYFLISPQLINRVSDQEPDRPTKFPLAVDATRLNPTSYWIRLPINGTYPTGKHPCIPVASANLDTCSKELARGRMVTNSDFYDHCFTRNPRDQAKIVWPEHKMQLTLEFSEEATHIVFYSPGQGYFAVEPVTHANNGVNMDGIAKPKNLSPGELLTLEMVVSVSRTDALNLSPHP